MKPAIHLPHFSFVLLTVALATVVLGCDGVEQPPMDTGDTTATEDDESSDGDPELEPDLPDPDPVEPVGSYEACQSDAECPPDHVCVPPVDGAAPQCRALCNSEQDCPASGMEDIEFPPLAWCDDGMCMLVCSEVSLIPHRCAEGWTCTKPEGKYDGACEQLE